MFRVHLISERAVIDGCPVWFYRAVVEQYKVLLGYPYAMWVIFDQSWLYDNIIDAENAARELEALYVA